MKPLQTLIDEKKPIVSNDELMTLFSYWDVILKCHQRLLKLLEERLKNWDIKPELGDIFLERVMEIFIDNNSFSDCVHQIVQALCEQF